MAEWLDDEKLIEAVARGLFERAMDERRTFSKSGEAYKFDRSWPPEDSKMRYGWYDEARYVLGEPRPSEDEL